VKTTLEIPDPIFRIAKAKAAERGIPLRQFVTEAVEDKIAAVGQLPARHWMEGFGKLRHLHKENLRIQKIIEDEFGKIEPEDRD
jgi:hypothetical protein